MIQQQSLAPQPSQAKLSTNLTTNYHPIHRWFNFIAGFSPEFVSCCIREARLTPEEKMIDPFAGLSTALVQANFDGIPSVGFEVHPFFYDMSLAKIFPPCDTSHLNALERIGLHRVAPYKGKLTDIWTPDAITFLGKLVPINDLSLLASALLLEDEVASSDLPLFRLVVSRVLELTAGSQTDGIYKAPTSSKRSTPYHTALRNVFGTIQEDVAGLGSTFQPLATLNQTSSESMGMIDDESCSLCITSPPYLNNFDFAEMTRMELYFWRYAGSWGEITERVRRKLVVNTTTAPTDLKHNQDGFSASLSGNFKNQVQPIIKALEEQRHIRAGKKDYYLLVYPYFSQIQAVIRELRRVLRPNSSFHMLVADSALYGVHVHTEQLIASLMLENGFEVLGIEHLRTRGTRWVLEKRQGSKEALGDFHIHARRI